jgi:ABC-type sugar transport system permease subunit
MQADKREAQIDQMDESGLAHSENQAAGGSADIGQRPPRRRLTDEEHRRLARRYGRKRILTAYGFLAPNLIFFTLFLLIPVVWVFWFSLKSGGVIGPTEFVGFSNWKEAFSDPLALKSLRNSAMFAAIIIPGASILGMIVALFLRNIRKGQTVFRATVYFPTLSPLVVCGLIWVFMVHPDFGAFNLIIRLFGGEPLNFLGSSALALPTVASVETWRGIGFWAVYFLAALIALPSELYEAAQLDGASGYRRFFSLTLPLLRPTILFALVLVTIYTLQIFDSVFVLTDGGPANSTATIVWYIYRNLFTYSNVGYGATLSFVLLIVILVLTLVQMRLLRGRKVS